MRLRQGKLSKVFLERGKIVATQKIEETRAMVGGVAVETSNLKLNWRPVSTLLDLTPTLNSDGLRSLDTVLYLQ